MKITTISVTVGRTVNLGSYESARIDYGATAELGPGDKPAKVRAALQDELLTALNAEVEAIHAGNAPPKRTRAAGRSS